MDEEQQMQEAVRQDQAPQTLEEFGGVELMKTPSCYAVFFPVDTTGDGMADDRDMSTFDTEEGARDFFNQILQR